jgi:hypothetical protein
MIIAFAIVALIGIDVLKTDNKKNGTNLSTELVIVNYALTIFASVVTNIINYGIGYAISGLT